VERRCDDQKAVFFKNKPDRREMPPTFLSNEQTALDVTITWSACPTYIKSRPPPLLATPAAPSH
jgi:hypothetical protein